MKTSSCKSYALGLILAAAFAAFMLLGTLSGSNFPRGIKGPPNIMNLASKWSELVSLGPNLVENPRWVWNDTAGYTVISYLNFLDSLGLKAILHSADWDNYDTTKGDTVPYWVTHYSCGQENVLEAEMDSSDAAYDLYHGHGTGFYFWEHTCGRAVGVSGASNNSAWYCSTAVTNNWTLFDGPKETATGACLQEPRYDYPIRPPGYHYLEKGRIFVFRLRARIESDGATPTDTVLLWQTKLIFPGPDSLREHDKYLTVDSFNVSDAWKEFWVFDTLNTTTDIDYIRTDHKLQYFRGANLWVDYIEYMDREQGYPLFARASLRDSTLTLIGDQCESLLSGSHGDAIAGFLQSNEPRRVSHRAHEVVKDYLMEQARLRRLTQKNALDLTANIH